MGQLVCRYSVVSVEDARVLLSTGGAALADVRPRIEFEEFRPGVEAGPLYTSCESS